jgi:hypothetical protein
MVIEAGAFIVFLRRRSSIVRGSPNRGKTVPANVTISVMMPSSIRSTSRASARHAASPGRST